MRRTDRITLRPAPPQADQPRCHLLRDGLDTHVIVDGAWLEAAVKTPGGYLLFLTDDVPFEEGLRILLLDEELAVRDSVNIGMMYTSGVFSDLRILDAHRLTFRFYAEPPWLLERFDAPRFTVPFFAEPLGVWRPFSFSRRFRIRRPGRRPVPSGGAPRGEA